MKHCQSTRVYWVAHWILLKESPVSEIIQSQPTKLMRQLAETEAALQLSQLQVRSLQAELAQLQRIVHGRQLPQRLWRQLVVQQVSKIAAKLRRKAR